MIISCHLAQADRSHFDSYIGTLLSLRTDGLPTDAALQKRVMTSAAPKQRAMGTDINWDFFFNFARFNDENMEDQRKACTTPPSSHNWTILRANVDFSKSSSTIREKTARHLRFGIGRCSGVLLPAGCPDW